VIELRPHEPGYPERLLILKHPPDPLWCSGELPDPSAKTVAVVGTRRLTVYGKRMAGEVAGSLAAAGAVIVSGLAQGIDSVAHEAALNSGGSTIAVLGEGLSHFGVSGPLRRRRLAERIRTRGALVSEYALDLRPTKWTFPRRNATIAALADVVVVVEAPLRSGALITAAWAKDLGKPVYAVPGPLGAWTWAGSNERIAAGSARLLLGPAAIASELGLTIAASAPAARSDPFSAKALAFLASGAADADTLAAALGLSAANATSLLAELFLSGAIAPTGDGRFARVR
jgi:DNA processing protein